MYQKNKAFVEPAMKTSDIIIGNPYLMLMLEHFEIKLGVHEKTVDQVCTENKINTELFITIANLYNGINPPIPTKYSHDDIIIIIRFLKNSHNYYLKEKYPQIKSFIGMINKVNDYSEIAMIEKFFTKYFIEVTEHLDYENDVVFPFVLNLDKRLTQKNYDDAPNNYSVTEYREHHDDIEEKLTDLKNLLIKYLPQKNDQHVRRQLLFCLFELEFDLKIHSQIEEAILIPLVEKMEQLAKPKK